ncbi:MAG: hypothetical protein JW702_07135 [Clostridiales bacterium]|nr:hypothetical protein [Clostridiales bacterium]MBN2710407.1 hypothetical protein [Calditrichaceae bacterium]
MTKLSNDFQIQFSNQQFTNKNVLSGISKNVKLHEELQNVRSSAAACINVFGYLNQNPKDIIPFFNDIGLKIDEVLKFPKGANLSGEIYDDDGPFVFEWIGPQQSVINEKGGSRGQNRTSIDAFLLVKIHDVITQLFIEWKFTETYNSETYLHKFGGKKGIERLRRYSDILASIRKNGFPFDFKDEFNIGLYDFAYEPFYQLLRMTLLAKMTTPIQISNIKVEDYRIIHLTHSEDDALNILSENHLKYSPGLKKYAGNKLHKVWHTLLTSEEKNKHIFGFWNKSLHCLSDNNDKIYLINRYE